MNGAVVRVSAAVVLGCMSGLTMGQEKGPSSSEPPYLLPGANGVVTRSILTTGDAVGGYRLAGAPDGLGALLDAGEKTFTLLVNHEIGRTRGARRAHGSKGAFVSRWTIERDTLKALSGRDDVPSADFVHTWDRVKKAYGAGTTVFERFCSGDLSPPSGLWHADKGTKERLYLHGEEIYPGDDDKSPDHGRAFAHVVTGPDAGHVWELPHVGKISFENVLVSPHTQERTIAITMDDAKENEGINTRSELYVYVGTRTDKGSEIDKAGLTNGKLYGAKLDVGGKAVEREDNAGGFGGKDGAYVSKARFSLVDFGDVSAMDGNALQAKSIEEGVTAFYRIEDGVWDPRPGHERDFYFATTAKVGKNSRLYRLRFDVVTDPAHGGAIDILLRGDEGHQMLDNMTMDRLGRIILQEDVGENDRLSKVWCFMTDTGRLIEIAAHDPQRFAPSGQSFITTDEESSGVIDAADILGPGWFLLDVQVHKDRGDELVEGGQLLAMFVDPALASRSSP